MRQQLREMLAVRQALISREELEGADAYYEKVKPLWARLQAGLEEDIKDNWTKIHADLANAKVKAIKNKMERREAERKADHEKMMAKWKAEREKRKADFEKMMAKMKAD
jgi:glutamate-1-semialdehyde aminotransferase